MRGATPIDEDCFAEGVPAGVTKEGLTDDDRRDWFGLAPAEWTSVEAAKIERPADMVARAGTSRRDRRLFS
jgi:hypothetical protein